MIANELRAYLSYRRVDEPLTYFRSRSQMEVDFVIGDRVAIEVKASGRVSAGDARGLLALAEDVRLKRKLIVCSEGESRRLDQGVEAIPVAEFLDRLWSDELL
jgi:predicted AAA+ superfamily ATPase